MARRWGEEGRWAVLYVLGRGDASTISLGAVVDHVRHELVLEGLGLLHDAADADRDDDDHEQEAGEGGGLPPAPLVAVRGEDGLGSRGEEVIGRFHLSWVRRARAHGRPIIYFREGASTPRG